MLHFYETVATTNDWECGIQKARYYSVNWELSLLVTYHSILGRKYCFPHVGRNLCAVRESSTLEVGDLAMSLILGWCGATWRVEGDERQNQNGAL